MRPSRIPTCDWLEKWCWRENSIPNEWLYYLHVDLDGKRNAFFELFGFLIEVFTERPNGNSFLEKKA